MKQALKLPGRIADTDGVKTTPEELAARAADAIEAGRVTGREAQAALGWLLLQPHLPYEFDRTTEWRRRQVLERMGIDAGLPAHELVADRHQVERRRHLRAVV